MENKTNLESSKNNNLSILNTMDNTTEVLKEKVH